MTEPTPYAEYVCISEDNAAARGVCEAAEKADALRRGSPKPEGYLYRQELAQVLGYATDLEGLVRHLLWLLGECLEFVPEGDSLRGQIDSILAAQAQQVALDELTRTAQEDGLYAAQSDGSLSTIESADE